MKNSTKRNLIIALAILLLGYCVSWFGNRPVIMTTLDARPFAMRIGSGGVYWSQIAKVEGPGNSAIYRVRRPGDSPFLVASGQDLGDFQIAGRSLFYIEQGQGGVDTRLPHAQGSIKRVSIHGGTPETLLEGLCNPGGLLVHHERLFWTENIPAPSPQLLHVPTCQYRALLRCAKLKDKKTETIDMTDQNSPTFRGTLALMSRHQILWGVESPHSSFLSTTRVARIDVSKDQATSLVHEAGLHNVVAAGRQLYGISPSEEAQSPSSCNRVLFCGIAEPIQEVADWLGSRGTLISNGSRLFYLDGVSIQEVPRHPGSVNTLFNQASVPSLCVAAKGSLYFLNSRENLTNGKKWEILRVPLTTWAKFWNGIHF